MKYIFDVAFLPSEVFKDHDVRIVVDLLRATTQITTFFDGGGSVLVPLKEVEAAFEMKERLGKDWKIMGERGGRRGLRARARRLRAQRGGGLLGRPLFGK